jgi:hypothetical protein
VGGRAGGGGGRRRSRGGGAGAPVGYGWSRVRAASWGTDGGSPSSGLVRDKAGNLYGTTEYGGDFTCNVYDGLWNGVQGRPQRYRNCNTQLYWTRGMLSLRRFAAGSRSPLTGQPQHFFQIVYERAHLQLSRLGIGCPEYRRWVYGRGYVRGALSL